LTFTTLRKATHGLGDFIKEQANTLAQYEELITGGDVENADQITQSQTAVRRQDATKPAVYQNCDVHPLLKLVHKPERDKAGKIHGVTSVTQSEAQEVLAMSMKRAKDFASVVQRATADASKPKRRWFGF
jgi:hypothetical protein